MSFLSICLPWAPKVHITCHACKLFYCFPTICLYDSKHTQFSPKTNLFQNLRWVLRGPTAIKQLNLKSLIKPSDKWGPARQEDRLQQELTLEKKNTQRDREEQNIITQDENSIQASLALSPHNKQTYGVNTDSYI